MEVLSVSDWFFLSKIRHKKVYYILHDPVPHSGETHWRKKIVSSIYYKFIDKFLLYSTFSTDLFNRNFPRYAERTLTLQTPIYTNLKIPIQSKISSIGKKVLFFGRISPYKGVELFYAAAEHLSKEFKDVQFIIAGKAMGGYTPDFLSDNSNPQIKIINQFIDLETLSELMTESSFCVLPYLDATQSGVVMTAYAYDLPVLVSDCPGLMEYCFDSSNFSFRNGELSDLINKMRNLLVDESLIQENKRDIGLYAARNVSEENVVKILNTCSAVSCITGNMERSPCQ
jgi:glycosyltransferase involved in cell wall biosynthesis